MHWSSEVLANGTKGTTSIAPMRGWMPSCCRRSMFRIALFAIESIAFLIPGSVPAIVRTVRWCVESDEQSSRVAPLMHSIARLVCLMTLRFLPSLMFGIDSIICQTPLPGTGRK